jgi:hypothetical protein
LTKEFRETNIITKLANKKTIQDRYEYTKSVATQNGHGLRIMTIPPKKTNL